MTRNVARALVSDELQTPASTVVRAQDGLAHQVFIAQLPDRRVVLRVNEQRSKLQGTEKTLRVLRSLGLPVSKVLAEGVHADTGLSWLILSYIPGRDLRHELAAMSRPQRCKLASQVIDAQRAVAVLPAADGYGYAPIGERPAHRSWAEVIRDDCAGKHKTSSERRLAALTEAAFAGLGDYLEKVPPTCFLDDLTTKNVLVSDGRLQGFIDFDCVCYGDPAYHIALTAVATVADVSPQALDYARAMLDHANADDAQRAAAAAYAAGIALRFLHHHAPSGDSVWAMRMATEGERWARTLRV